MHAFYPTPDHGRSNPALDQKQDDTILVFTASMQFNSPPVLLA
jgi:hypothetical protein